MTEESGKKKYQIALRPDVHDTLKEWASQSSVNVGDIVEFIVDAVNFRLGAALRDGEIPPAVAQKAPFLEVAELVMDHDAGNLEDGMFSVLMGHLAAKYGQPRRGLQEQLEALTPEQLEVVKEGMEHHRDMSRKSRDNKRGGN